jgi:hypothetical protein
MITPEIERIAKKASVKIHYRGDELIIKKVFRMNNSANIGVLLLMAGGAFLTYLGTVNSGGVVIKSIFVLLGAFMFVAFLWVFIAQFIDRVIITNIHIEAVYKLKKTVWASSGDLSATMKSERVVVKSVLGPESFFRVVHIDIKSGGNETCIFTFQMDNKYAAEADKLGNELAQLINKKPAT